MKIEVWSDFACPFCYIGKRRLERALERFEHRDHVDIVFRSFELDPYAPVDQEESIAEMLAKKYGMSVDEAKKMNESVAAQAASVGLTFRFDRVQLTNTFTAHRLVHFAKTKGKALELTDKLFQAYFSDGVHLNDEAALIDIAASVGLARADVRAVIQDESEYADGVRADETEAQRLGVRGVPFFVLNEKYALSGAQPEEVFLQAFEKVWQEEEKKPVLESLSDDGASCGDGECTLPEK